MSLATYSHSGRMGLSSMLLGPAVGLVVAAGLAYLYQYAVYFIPFIYLNLLLTLALGAGVGFACGFALKFGKCRNAALAVFIGAACGVTATAVSHWVSYQHLVSDVQKEYAVEGATFESVENAISFGEYFTLKSEIGWAIGNSRVGKTNGGMPISGVFVWIIWLVEMGAVAGVAGLLARRPIDLPFCESCDQWTVAQPAGSLTPAAISPLSSAIEKGDMAALLTPQRDPRSDKTAVFTLHRCTACANSGYLSCKLNYKVMEKGKPTQKSDPVFDFVAVDESQIETLKQSLAGAAREPLPKFEPAQNKPLTKFAPPARKPLPGKPANPTQPPSA